MTREDAEECLSKGLKVVTRYGLGEVMSLSKKSDSIQWAKIKQLDPDRQFEAPRCLYLSSISRYTATSVEQERVDSNF
jgi:hypothetical protein